MISAPYLWHLKANTCIPREHKIVPVANIVPQSEQVVYLKANRALTKYKRHI